MAEYLSGPCSVHYSELDEQAASFLKAGGLERIGLQIRAPRLKVASQGSLLVISVYSPSDPQLAIDMPKVHPDVRFILTDPHSSTLVYNGQEVCINFNSKQSA